MATTYSVHVASTRGTLSTVPSSICGEAMETPARPVKSFVVQMCEQAKKMMEQQRGMPEHYKAGSRTRPKLQPDLKRICNKVENGKSSKKMTAPKA